jgi:L-threonylcarbamoyladenylate synthase
MTNEKTTQSNLEFAYRLLTQGKLVAIPTETVYGLAADASQPDAIERVFLAKGRPCDHPLIVHLANVSQIWDWGKGLSTQSIKDIELLAAHFWPGPLTLIIKKADWVPNIITGQQDTVAIRVPNHPLTLALLQKMPNGLVAPSANRFGRISPTTPAHVLKELGDKVDYILDGGPCNVGIESTILNLSGEEPIILRPGMISSEQIAAVLKKPILQNSSNATSIRAPGVLDSHYAPKTPFYRICDTAAGSYTHTLSIEQLIAELKARLPHAKIALIGHEECSKENLASSRITYHGLSADPRYFSQKIYDVLHALDEGGVDLIFCYLNQTILNQHVHWDSVLDRLKKATLDTLHLDQIHFLK